MTVPLSESPKRRKLRWPFFLTWFALGTGVGLCVAALYLS